MTNIQLHTVLGASGTIGKAVVEQLKQHNLNIRTVAHQSKNTDFQVDFLNQNQLNQAIAGSSHVYLCIGIPYQTKIWREQWPEVIKNTIKACLKHQAKLIFFDNVYLYSNPLPIPFDENTLQNPTSEKGKIRKICSDLILYAIKNQQLEAVIVRSADFYGPNAKNSMLYISFIENYIKNKAPMSLAPIQVPHTYAYTEDLAKALVLIALETDTYSQVWHLPVGKPITLEEISHIINTELNMKHQIKLISPFLKSILSLFIPALKELKEMMYQFEQTYILNDTKFRNRFPNFEHTDYKTGIIKTITSFKK